MLADQFKTAQNQFDRLGHPGNITEVYTYTGGSIDFTGSMYGYGAVIARINTLGVVPLSVKQIYGGTGAEVFVFKVQGTV